MGFSIRSRDSGPPLPPRKPSHLQQQHKPRVHGGRQAKYNCSCGTNRETTVCSCATCNSILRSDNSPCSYFGCCVEPLAWNIEHELVRTQGQSPLFTSLPREIRDLIFEFALTDTKVQSLESLLRRAAPGMRLQNGGKTHDIATNLLRTCRAIYLETWTLPLSRNSYIVRNFNAPPGLDGQDHKPRLLPWQLALIQGLDITLQQASLESGILNNYLHRNSGWFPGPRHQGIYIAPHRYRSRDEIWELKDYLRSFVYILIPANKEYPRHFLSQILGEQQLYSKDHPPPWSSAMRVMLARPITHLTLRINHTEWWTWTDHPASSDDIHQLGLDPSVGDGNALPLKRPTASRMRALAEARRAGRHPELDPSVGWASTIAQMPDLRSLELVLETFSLKRTQLDDVVEAAKTWKFELEGGQWELVWDGEVGMSSWSRSGNGVVGLSAAWYKMANEFDVRNVRYTRRRVV